MLCTVALDNQMLKNYLTWAHDGFIHNDIPYFRFMFDFAWGSSFIWRGIQEAVDSAEQTPEESDEFVRSQAAQVKNAFGVSDNTREVEMGIVLKIKNLLEARVLIQEDPRGFSLVDTYVTRFRETPEQVLNPSQAKEYALLGAEVARDLYKEMYRIATPLYDLRST